jgi:protein BCP1
MPNRKKLKANNIEDKKLSKKEKDQAAEEASSTSGDEDDDEVSSNDEQNLGEEIDQQFNPNEEIMIDFEAREPQDTDYETVNMLLQQKLKPFSLNLNELTKILVQQSHVGNVIYQALNDDDMEPSVSNENNNSDDETIFGILSIVNLSSPRVKTFANSMNEFLIKEYDKYAKKSSSVNNRLSTSELAELIKTKKIFYVVNERFINIPPEISVPMFESLNKDLDKINKEKRDDSDFKVNEPADYWLFLSRVFNEPSNSGSSSKVYSNSEEEIFEEFSNIKFEISYINSNSGSSKAATSSSANEQVFLRVFLLPNENIKPAMDKIKILATNKD